MPIIYSDDASRLSADLQRLAYSVYEVASLLGLSDRFVRSLVKNGEIPSIRIKGRVLIPAEALQRRVIEWTEARDV